MKLERSQGFYAISNEKVKCPVPGCLHTGDVITKVHCRDAHGLERGEVKELYGTPYRILPTQAMYSREFNTYSNGRD